MLKQVRLGQSDLEVGCISYGHWRFVGHEISHAQALIETALDAGMTLMDTADVYGYGSEQGFGGAETLLGEVLKAAPHLRSQMVIASKGGIDVTTPYNSSAAYITAAIDASLTRLGTHRIDLYQIHRPDLIAAPEETAHALNAAVKAGKVGHIGVSNYTVPQIRALQAHLDTPIISLQIELSALRQAPIEKGNLDWCLETGAACLAWSPLAGGDIPRLESDAKNAGAVLRVLRRLAETNGAKPEQIALAFLLTLPGSVIPIIGSQTAERISAAATSSTITLSRRDCYDIIEAKRGGKMP